jgi:hypothetical protein
VFAYLTPDLSTLVIRSSAEVSRYTWPGLVNIDELTITGGQQIGVDSSNVYRHSGFTLTSFPLGSTTGTNIGTTIGGGGQNRPVVLAADGFLYMLSDVAGATPPRLRQFSTSGASSSPGTVVATFTGYDAATRPFYTDGGSIWLPLRLAADSTWHLVEYDTASTTITDHGVLSGLHGVLHDGSLVGDDGTDLTRVVPTSGSYTSSALCPSLPQLFATEVTRRGSVAVGVIRDGSDWRVYKWPASNPWSVGRVVWGSKGAWS